MFVDSIDSISAVDHLTCSYSTCGSRLAQNWAILGSSAMVFPACHCVNSLALNRSASAAALSAIRGSLAADPPECHGTFAPDAKLSLNCTAAAAIRGSVAFVRPCDHVLILPSRNAAFLPSDVALARAAILSSVFLVRPRAQLGFPRSDLILFCEISAA